MNFYAQPRTCTIFLRCCVSPVMHIG